MRRVTRVDWRRGKGETEAEAGSKQRSGTPAAKKRKKAGRTFLWLGFAFGCVGTTAGKIRVQAQRCSLWREVVCGFVRGDWV